MWAIESFAVLEHGGSIVDLLLSEQHSLAAVEQFASWHATAMAEKQLTYRALMPIAAPSSSEQYAFDVDLDRCSGCKACVVACHTMNGLDDHESWRHVGTLVGGVTRRIQHVTTACHHCVEPGCLLGCPVQAYEKEPYSGIVRHLDDQCIGCKYCTMMCPYEVPQYNERLGIVRKCDMCRQRLAVDEAPACVQACPNQAIKIVLVHKETMRAFCGTDGATLVPTAPLSSITRPTTNYHAVDNLADASGAGFINPSDSLADSHWPLALMLVLTQASLGWFFMVVVEWMWRSANPVPSFDMSGSLCGAWLLAVVGLNLASLHLGQPLRAWRVFLGLRTSWLSREAVAFGGYLSGLSVLSGGIGLERLGWLTKSLAFDLVVFAAGATALLFGLFGWFSSAQIYIVTRRWLWRPRRTWMRFGGTTLIMGLLLSAVTSTTFAPRGLAGAAGLLLVVKLIWEIKILFSPGAGQCEKDRRAGRMAQRQVPILSGTRIISAVVSFMLITFAIRTVDGSSSAELVIFGLAGLVALLGECCERLLYFCTVVYDRMPQAMPSFLAPRKGSCSP